MTVRALLRAVIVLLYRKCTAKSLHIHKSRKAFFRTCAILLPATNRGKGKEGLTAKSNSVRQYYSMRSRNMSTSRPSGRFFYCFRPNFCLTVRLSRRFMTILRLHDTRHRSPSAPPLEPAAQVGVIKYVTKQNDRNTSDYPQCCVAERTIARKTDDLTNPPPPSFSPGKFML